MSATITLTPAEAGEILIHLVCWHAANVDGQGQALAAGASDQAAWCGTNLASLGPLLETLGRQLRAGEGRVGLTVVEGN